MRAVRWATMAAVAIALAVPSGAAAGGFATVGLGSLPDGTPPGTPWHVTLTILQHGRTPLPGAAGAGGMATVGLSSLPDGTAPGRPWRVTLTILQHGRTPMAGLHPTVRIRRAGGGVARTFAARPAGRPGLYTVDVVFPSAGTWRYAIDDGFTQTHTFAPVAIGASRAVPAPRIDGRATPVGRRADGADLAAAFAAAAAAGLLAGLLTALALRRRSRPGPATAPVR